MKNPQESIFKDIRQNYLLARIFLPLLVIGSFILFCVYVKINLFIIVFLLLLGLAAFFIIKNPLIGLAFLIGLSFLPYQFGSLTAFQLNAALTVFAVLMWYVIKRKTLYFGNLFVPLIAYLCIVALSFFHAINLDAATKYFYAMIVNIIIYLLIVNVIDDSKKMRIILYSIIGMALINAIAGVYQSGRSEEYYFRATGLTTQPNAFAELLVIAFPLAFYYFLYGTRKRAIIGLLISMILIMGIVSSVSRGAFFALIATCILICVLEIKKFKRILIFLLMVAFAVPFFPGYFFERMENLPNEIIGSIVINQEKLSDRGYLNKAGIEMWKDHPFFGVGSGNFADYYFTPEYNPGHKRGEKKLSHNTYIEALAENGIIGFALFIWILFSVAMNFISNRKIGRSAEGINQEVMPLARSLEMMFFGYMVNCLAGSNLYSHEFVMILALSVVVLKLTKKEVSQVS